MGSKFFDLNPTHRFMYSMCDGEKNMLRSIASIVVLLMSVLLIAIANIGWWVRTQVLDAHQFAAAATRSLADPNVHSLLVEGTTLAVLNVARHELKGSPELYQSSVREAVEQVLAMPEFIPIFQQAVVLGHDALFTEKFQHVELDLNPILPILSKTLKTTHPALFSQLPPLQSVKIPVVSGDQIPSIAKPAQEFRKYAIVLIVAACIMSILFVIISSRRDRAFAVLGASLAIIVGFQILFVEIVLPHMLSWIQEPTVRNGVAAILHNLLVEFTVQSYQLLYLGIGLFAVFLFVTMIRGRSQKTDTRANQSKILIQPHRR